MPQARRASIAAPLLAVGLLALASLATPGGVPSATAQSVNCNPPNGGEWRIRAETVYCQDRDITVANLTLDLGGTATFQNVRLHIDAKYDAGPVIGQGIFALGSGVKLTVLDSTIDSVGHAHLIKLSMTGSALDVQRSTLRDFYVINVWSCDTTCLLDGNQVLGSPAGIGSDVIGPNVKISNNFIDGENIRGSLGVGAFNGATPTVTGNTIVRSSIGILIQGTSQSLPTITDNTLVGNGAGITQDITFGSPPQEAHNNDIFDNWNRGAGSLGGNIAMAGDATNNWFGQVPPDASFIIGAGGGAPPTYTPYLTAPVHPERLPTASVTPASATALVGQAVSFDASGSRPSTQFNFPLATYDWSFGDGATTTGTQVQHAYTHPGTYTARVDVRDTHGLMRSATATVHITNRPPTATGAVIQPANPAAGADLTLTASTSDPDGDSLTYTYAWTRNGALQPDLTASTVPGAWVRSADSWQGTITATDPSGATATATATTSILNRPPTLSLDMSPTNPAAGDSLFAQAVASDPDNEPSTLSYAWALNGNPQSITTFYVPGNQVRAGDVWRATVTASDGHGGSAQQSRSITVGNQAPTLTSLVLSPSNPTKASTLQATPTGSDPEGDPLMFKYQWQRNGIPQTSLTSSTVAGAQLSKGDTWTVSVTPNDGHSDGATLTRSVTIQNTAPTVSQATATPTTVATGSAVQLHLAAQDLDNDPLTITWTLPGGAQRTGADVTVSFATAGSQTIQYAASDGSAQATGSLTVTVTQPPASTGSGSGAGSGNTGGEAGGNSGGSQSSGGSSTGSDPPLDPGTTSNPAPPPGTTSTTTHSSTTQQETATQAESHSITTAQQESTTSPEVPPGRSTPGTGILALLLLLGLARLRGASRLGQRRS